MAVKRERWPSKIMFLFAVVGSSVGLGNIWRFPYLAGKYGGGAFLIPYVMALFFIGFPLLLMEFTLGQMMQQGAVGAMRKIDKKLSGIGLGAVLSSFGVSCYYALIMGWCILYMYYSINLSWGDAPKSFFLDEVLRMSPSAGQIEGISLPVLGALALAWVLVYFSVWKGVKSVSAVVKITMPLPIILLVLLLVRTLFLPGALTGLDFYLRPQFSAIWDLDVWMAAITQIFFTLTLGFGVMITYSSYRDTKSDIVQTALITCIADVAIALLAGFVIFATVGYMSETSGIPLEEIASSGPTLTFIVLPQALSLIPWAPLFAFLFFLTMITLAIDSLFSLVEAIATLFEDHFPRVTKKMIVFFVCLAGFLGGIVFTTSAGIYYLDITDHFMTHYGLVFMGLLQVIAVGWGLGPQVLRKFMNDVSVQKVGPFWDISIQYIIPGCLMAILIREWMQDWEEPYGGYPEWAIWSFGWGLVLCMIIVCLGYSFFQGRKKS